MALAGIGARVVGFTAGIESLRRRGQGASRATSPEAKRSWLYVRHVSQILMTALLGTVLSVVCWLVVLHWEDRALEVEFGARANNIASTLEAGMEEQFSKIAALRALFKSSEHNISRTEFQTFAGELLRGQSAILSVSWIPRVKRGERSAHELGAVRDGLAGYRIKSVAPDGSMATAPERDEYFPVYYTTEKQYSDPVYGLDLADGGIREETLNLARDDNRLATSKVIVLHSGTGDRHGFFVLLPFYRNGVPHKTVEERRRNLIGFVQGVFQLSTMVETILGALTTPLDLHIFTPDSGPNALPIYIHSSSQRVELAGVKPLAVLSAGPHWYGKMKIADLDWKLVAVPIPGARNARHVSAWLLLIAGFVVTGVIVGFMWSSMRHALQLLRANQKVSELAQTDPLTNLANRRAFIDRLSASFAGLARNLTPFAVHYIDLDHFKDVNDTLGHSIGDVLLQQASERLKKAAREDDLVARFGGDEFAVLQTDAFESTASGALAGRIIAALGNPYFIEGNEVCVTASIGISHSSSALEGPDAAMMQADLALYRAKEDGRNCFRFHNMQLDQQVRMRVKMADELRVAIGSRQLELYYQPQVDIRSGRIVGLEALVRWNHPKHGLIAPSLFIPIAEKTGSIITLGKWVFDEACRQLKVWQDEGIAPALVAVNLSAIQCKRSDLEQDIAESLKRWGIKPAKMEVELTESVLMEATHEHSGIVERIRKLGLNVAIDDFGTGYSSLNYLTKYPVDRLKIAQELVFAVTTDSRHATVVKTAIRLAQELDIEVIAEGVETAEQARFLVSAGCKYAQGYHFSRPVTAESVTTLLRQGIMRPAEQSTESNDFAAA